MQPYEPQELPLKNIDWINHIALISQANASLARYDGMVENIVNPMILLSPLTTQEAVLSSKIEGTHASLEDVLEFEISPHESLETEKKYDIHEIINYRRAMNQAQESLRKRPLCLNLIKELHKTLLNSVRGSDKTPGEFRNTQNFIGTSDGKIISFVPPLPEKVLPALYNWEAYLNSVEKDALVQLAIVKAQFELIHPFKDGNGRLGRMLIPLFLYDKKILSNPVFYLSSYLETHRDAYIESLKSISRDNDWNRWISFFLTAIIEQSSINVKKTKEILELYNKVKNDVPDVIKSQYTAKVIDVLFDYPIFTSSSFSSKTKIPKPSTTRIIKALSDAKIIRTIRKGSGRSPSIMVFEELLTITKR